MPAQATIVSVIAPNATATVAAAAAAATNVNASGDAPLDPSDRRSVAELWAAVRRRPPVYALAPFDPFQSLIDAWADRLTGAGDSLELAIGLYPKLEPPDFYVVDGQLEEPLRAWYFEMLFSEAPRRIHAFDGTVDGVIRALRELTFGVALPAAADLGPLARTFVPGTGGLAPVASAVGPAGG